jgi:hypothetical protein
LYRDEGRLQFFGGRAKQEHGSVTSAQVTICDTHTHTASAAAVFVISSFILQPIFAVSFLLLFPFFVLIFTFLCYFFYFSVSILFFPVV